MKSESGMKNSNFPYNRHFFPTQDENFILHTRDFFIYFLKNKDGDFCLTNEPMTNFSILQNVYKNLEVPWYSENAAQT